MTEHHLGRLTSAEARVRLAAGTVVLLPLGSQEDQGPHAPMGDYLVAERIAQEIAERAAGQGVDVLVAPTLPFGGADYFAPIPGAMSLGQATLRAVLADMVGALLRHGITRLVVVNGHGGNAQAIHDVTLAARQAQGVWIPCLGLWKIAAQLLPELIGAEAAAARLGHGADPLASVAAHLFPARMRPDLTPARAAPATVFGLEVCGFASVAFAGVAIDLPLEIDQIAPTGVAGADARLCSAQTGAALVARLVEIGAALAAHVAAQPGPVMPPV